METSIDYEDPGTVPAAVRAQSLVGCWVKCRPNGPMGPEYAGRVADWGYERGEPVVEVDCPGVGVLDCWPKDVRLVTPEGNTDGWEEVQRHIYDQSLDDARRPVTPEGNTDD